MTQRADRFDHAVRIAPNRYDREHIAEEVLALTAVVAALEGLSGPARRRVLRYCSDRFDLGVRFQ